MYPNNCCEQQDTQVDLRNLNVEEQMLLLNLKQVSEDQRKQVAELSQSIHLTLEVTRHLLSQNIWIGSTSR
jgi:hypothetical protein